MFGRRSSKGAVAPCPTFLGPLYISVKTTTHYDVAGNSTVMYFSGSNVNASKYSQLTKIKVRKLYPFDIVGHVAGAALRDLRLNEQHADQLSAILPLNQCGEQIIVRRFFFMKPRTPLKHWL